MTTTFMGNHFSRSMKRIKTVENKEIEREYERYVRKGKDEI